MNIESLRDLFEFELEGVYYLETELEAELAQLVEQSRVNSLDDLPDGEFRDATGDVLASHREETAEHARRLEEVFERLEREPNAREVPALDGLFAEKERFNNLVLDDALRNVFYLDVGRKAEQLELQCYDSLLRHGARLDLPEEVADAIESNRDEDAAALQRLEELAGGDDADALLDALAEETPAP